MKLPHSMSHQGSLEKSCQKVKAEETKDTTQQKHFRMVDAEIKEIKIKNSLLTRFVCAA